MTALSIDASNRDSVIGWEAITPPVRWVNPYDAAVKKAWDERDAEIERQLDAGEISDRPLIDEMAEAAMHIQRLAYDAYNKHQQDLCVHEWELDSMGGWSLGETGPTDDIREFVICRVCGKEKGE